MTITSITPYSKGKGRMAVYLNDEFAFVLYKGELSKYKLEIGMDMTDDLYCRILDETLVKRARLRGMNLLMKQDRTEADIRRKLTEGGYPSRVVSDAIDYLKSFHYIDDERYASNYFDMKKTSCSRKEICRKLKEKGISDDIISSVADIQMQCDDIEVIKRLMLKKCNRPHDLDYEGRMRLFSFFYRKGFDISTIEHAYSTILDESIP